MYYNLPLESPTPGHQDDPGVHVVDLHYRSSNALRHESVQVNADDDPLSYPIGELAMFVLERADEQSPDRHPQRPSFTRLVGMTIYRAGIREVQSPQQRTGHQLAATKLVSIGFVKKTGLYQPAELPRSAKVSAYGVTSMRVGDGFRYVQLLGATPEEEAKYPVSYAVPSLSVRGNDSDTWIALRPKTDSGTKQRNSFVERIVTLEELKDTRK